MASYRQTFGLTLFGKFFVGTILVVIGSLVGEMFLSSEEVKKGIHGSLEVSNKLNSGFKFENKVHEAGLIESYGSFDVVYGNLCKSEFLPLSKVSYQITHVPFGSDKIEVVATPLKYFKAKVSGQTEDKQEPILKASGVLTDEGLVQMNYQIPTTEWYDQISGALISITETSGKISNQAGQFDIQGVSRLIEVGLPNDSLGFEGVNFSAKFAPSREEAILVSLGVGKIKSGELFARDMSLRVQSTVKERILVTDGTLAIDVASYKGNPVEKVDAVFDFSANDVDSLFKIRDILSATCGGKLVDEEQRLELRMSADELVKAGIQARVSRFSWTGPRGDFNFEASAGMSEEKNANTGLPDFHKGFFLEAKGSGSSLYATMPFMSELTKNGTLVNSNNGLVGTMSIEKKRVSVNGKSSWPASFYETEINDFMSSVVPSIEDSLQMSGLDK